MKKIVFLVGFLLSSLVSAQSKDDDNLIYLNEYTKVQGFICFNEDRAVQILRTVVVDPRGANDLITRSLRERVCGVATLFGMYLEKVSEAHGPAGDYYVIRGFVSLEGRERVFWEVTNYKVAE